MNRGRPKKENNRKKKIDVRVNEDEFEMILYFSNETGENYSDVVRKALRTYYNLKKNRCI